MGSSVSDINASTAKIQEIKDEATGAAARAVDYCYEKGSDDPDPSLVKKIQEATEKLCQDWEEKKSFIIEKVYVYVEPLSMNGSSAAAGGGAFGGICHTLMVIEFDSNKYILERLVEGIRFSNLNDLDINPVQYSVLMKAFKNESIASHDMIKWIRDKALKPYRLGTNNCIHFVRQFGHEFMSQAVFFDSVVSLFRKARDCLKIEIDNEMVAVTMKLCDKWDKKNFKIKDLTLYVDAAPTSSKRASSAVSGAAPVFSHAFIIIDTGSDDYILDRIESGVRLLNASDLNYDPLEFSNSRVVKANEQLSSAQIATWIRKEALNKFSSDHNNDIHFVKRFGQMFTEDPLFSKKYPVFEKELHELAVNKTKDNN